MLRSEKRDERKNDRDYGTCNRGAQVVLEPRGYHLMLIGLNEQLVEGEAISIALEFEQAGEVELEFEVRPLRE